MTAKKRKTSDAVEILYNRLYKGKPERIASLQSEYLNSRIAAMIYNLRMSANMTQAEFARKLGTKASAISRIESSDYDGHSLKLLNKIADLFDAKIEITMVPAKSSQKFLRSPRTGNAIKGCRQISA